MKAFFLIIVVFLIFSCSENKSTSANEGEVPAEQLSELKVGGLYLLKNKDNTFHLTKILVLDEFAVHLRTYADTFTIKPTDINSKNLKILIGHAPLDPNSFLLENPQLLKVESVDDSELEGYKIYLQAMQQ